MIALFISCFSNKIFKFQRGILKRLCAGEVIVGDGGMTYALERRGYVKAGPWTPECTVEHPKLVRNNISNIIKHRNKKITIVAGH